MAKHIEYIIDECAECPKSSIFSCDCTWHATCCKAMQPLPADGKDTLEYGDWFEIPDWCQLDEHEE